MFADEYVLLISIAGDHWRCGMKLVRFAVAFVVAAEAY